MSVPEILEAASGTESPKTPSTPTAPRSRHSFASDDASEKDPSPPSTPKKAVLQNRHAKLRLTRSYDPNVTRHRADRPHSCREPEHKQDVTDDNEHSILRPVKSLTLGGGNILHHIIESDSPISSPRSKKKYNYLQKMAMIFHGPKSPSSATSSPVYSDEECSVYSDSDFYFDNTSPIASPTVMHRGKLPSSASSRLIPKKWRFKSSSSKLVSCATATLWSSEGNCRWVSMSGRTVQLTNTLLPYVSDMERITLQKVALQRLQGYELGVITIPKDCSLKRSKKSNFSLKGRGKNSSFWDNFKDIGKENKDSGNGLVFGISLTKCISNDIALKRKRSTQRKERRESLDLANTVYRIKPANGKNNEAKEIVKRQVIASESSASTESNKSTANASLLDALSLSTSSSDCHRKEKRKALMVREPQVPHIVASCFKYIENHGIRVLGIFRVGGSKKRIKQLRDEFDSGDDVKLYEGCNPHDIAAMLKEYFRDLPEPLLSKELYSAYVAISGIEKIENRVKALHYLVCLLPPANIDTLYALLRFLHKVASNAKDSIDKNGEELPGNKMDSHNLATLFGPNLLHRLKPGPDFHPENTTERVEESREIIDVVKCMIDNHGDIFQISAEDHHEVMKILLETDPEALDFILNRISSVLMGYRPSTSESNVWEDNDISSAPHTPNSDIDLFGSRTKSTDGSQSPTVVNHVPDSPSASPRQLPQTPQPPHKTVAFSPYKTERERFFLDTTVVPEHIKLSAVGMKKKKSIPPNLDLSASQNELKKTNVYSPPVSPVSPLPSYAEHIQTRKSVLNNNWGKPTTSQLNNSSITPKTVSLSPPLKSASELSKNSAPLSAGLTSPSNEERWSKLNVKRTLTPPLIRAHVGSVSDDRRTESGMLGKKNAYSGDKSPIRIKECDKDKWMQWKQRSSESSTGDMYEQETLV